MKPPPRIEVSIQELQTILEHARPALSVTEFDALQGAMQTLQLLTRELEKKGVSIQRLRQMLFGAATETTAKVLEKILDRVGKEPADGVAEEKAAPGKKPKGHGRNGAEDYTGARKVRVPLTTLHAGDPCPSCAKGTVYASCEPGRIVRLTGQAPIGGTVYELEKLRCSLCGEVFSAVAPEGVGEKKFDAESAAMIALLKYGTGLPFHRLEGLQANLGIPLPAATQWEIVEETAGFLTPAMQEMIRLAAQGEVLHNDDTTMKVLSLGAARCTPDPAAAAAEPAVPTPATAEPAAATTPTMTKPATAATAADTEPPSSRTGVFTSGIVAKAASHTIALFFTGHKHAGENLLDLLRQRSAELAPPIQMCDALPRSSKRSWRIAWPMAGDILWTSPGTFPTNACWFWRFSGTSTGTTRWPGNRGCLPKSVWAFISSRAAPGWPGFRPGWQRSWSSARSSPTAAWARPSPTCKSTGTS